MAELKRLFWNGRRLGTLFLLAALCTALFLYSLMDGLGPGKWESAVNAGRYAAREAAALAKLPPEELPAAAKAHREDWWAAVREERTEYDDLIQQVTADMIEDAAHIAGYGAYLEKVQKQAELQSKTSLFGAEGSFSRRNLEKTAADFLPMLGTRVSFGNNRGIEKWLSYELGDYFGLVGIVLFVLGFLEERKMGLWPVVRATKGGRLRLGLVRVGLLLLASALCAFLFSGLNLLLSLALNGGWEGLGRSLQSVKSFRTCTIQITISQWLWQYFAVKTLSGFTVGLLLWGLLGTLANPQFSLSVLGVTLAAEYALYALLPVQSAFNILKYVNLFALIRTSSIYVDYLNVNLFGWPVGNRALALTLLPTLMALGGLWALGNQTLRRPEGNRDILSALSQLVNRALDALRRHLRLGGWEWYKALVYEYGAALLVLVFVASGSLSFGGYVVEDPDAWYRAYLADAAGPIGAETEDYLRRARQSAAESGEADALLRALDRLEARMETLKARAAAGGYAPWLTDDRELRADFGKDSVDRQRLNAAAALLFTALLTAGLLAYENEAGVTSLLRATKNGRRTLWRCKVASAALLTGFVWAVVWLRELWWIFMRLTSIAFGVRKPGPGEVWAYLRTPGPLWAPVGNFDDLAAFPLRVPLGGYLALLYGLRLVMLLSAAWLCLWVTGRVKSLRLAYLAGAAALVLPALMVLLGAEPVKFFSPLVPAAAAELLWAAGKGEYTPLLAFAALFLLGHAALRRTYSTAGGR
ncbi:MAG: hypothetical protein ACSW8F_00775 [bacterium]